MTCKTTTYNAIEFMSLDESTVEALGAAYEAGDLTELGRLYAAAINRQLSKESQRRREDYAGLFGALFDKQFNDLFARDSEGRL